MNNKELGSRKLLKLEYRKVEQIIQAFYKFGFPQKLGTPCLIFRKFKTLRKVLVNYAKWIEIS